MPQGVGQQAKASPYSSTFAVNGDQLLKWCPQPFQTMPRPCLLKEGAVLCFV